MACKFNFDPKFLNMLWVDHFKDLSVKPPRPNRDAKSLKTRDPGTVDRINSSKVAVCVDILLAKFIMAHVKENVYLSLQKIFNLKNLNKRKQYNDIVVQYLEISMGKGLCMTGYQAVLLENEKRLPPEVTAMMPVKFENDAEKNVYLAQFLCTSHLSRNMINSCDKHYAKIKSDRAPLYVRKPT